jgi:putative flippase GtrA
MRFAAKIFNYIFHGKIKHMVRFSIVGVSNTIIDFVAFTILFSVLGLSYIPSQILGYSVGVFNSFIFNRKWTFGDNRPDKKTGKKTIYEFMQFVVINVISLTTSVIVMDILVRYVNMNVYLSKVLVIMIAQIINFLSYKLWVFSPRKSIAA